MAPGGGSGGGSGSGAGVKPKFSDGEKLLCYHGPLLYEAKCVKSKREGANNFQYYIHYQGWNKNWDEWVQETRILKINPENLDRKEKLLSSHMNSLKDAKKRPDKPEKPGLKTSTSAVPPGKKGSGTPSTPVGTPSGGQGGTDSASTSRASTPVSDRSVKIKRVPADDEKSTSSDDQGSSSRRSVTKKAKLSTSEGKGDAEDSDMEDVATADVRFTIDIPEELKYVLVSDWDLMTHKKSLFSLPAKTPVAVILSEYSSAANKKISANVVSEVVQGIQEFFDVFVGKCLLYKVERPQYRTVTDSGNKKPSEIYGSAHLLRLMVKIGGLLDKFKLNTTVDHAKLIETTILDLLKYLETNRSKLFTSKNYVEASDDYLKTVE